MNEPKKANLEGFFYDNVLPSRPNKGKFYGIVENEAELTDSVWSVVMPPKTYNFVTHEEGLSN